MGNYNILAKIDRSISQLKRARALLVSGRSLPATGSLKQTFASRGPRRVFQITRRRPAHLVVKHRADAFPGLTDAQRPLS